MLRPLFRYRSIFLLLAVVLVAICHAGTNRSALRWVVCYSDKPQPEEFQGFELVVLDSDTHPPLASLAAERCSVNTGKKSPSHRECVAERLLKGVAEPNKRLLAYLSLGEIATNRPYFAAVKAEGLLLGENPNWRGSFYVETRDPRWQRRVVEDLVPGILAAGFAGVFLDTLDDPAALERSDPKRYSGMTSSAADLVRSLRQTYPRIHIMVNRGFELMPAIAPFIDSLLGESVYTTYDAARKRYLRVPAEQYQQQVALMRQALRWNRKLLVCALDYWDPADTEEIRRIYAIERRNGFAPYVATPDLDQIVRVP
jgi:polysaccharide biosynthesis protein PelA